VLSSSQSKFIIKKMEKTLKKEIYSINPSEEFFVVNCIDWVFTEDKAHDLDKKYQGHVIYNGKDFSYEYLDLENAIKGNA